METKPSAWPYAFKYGAIIALANIAVSLIFFLIDPNGAVEGRNGWIQTVLTVAINAVVLVLAANARRKNDMGGYMPYSQSLGLACMIGIPSALIMAIYIYLYFTVLNPGIIEAIATKQQEALLEKGLSEEQVEAQMSMMRTMSSPWIYTIFGIVGNYFWVFIVGLITSIFTSKNNPNPAGGSGPLNTLDS